MRYVCVFPDHNYQQIFFTTWQDATKAIIMDTARFVTDH